jgi:carbonic anhydrase
MCECRIDRRALGKILAGAAGAGWLPGAARAAEVTALGITCIDYRLVGDTAHFFADKNLTKDYDQVSLAGASLAAVSSKFPASSAAFWEHIKIAKQLHHIKKVIVVDHRDCGAFKVAYGKAYRGDAEGETEQHKQVMERVKAQMAKSHPDLACEFYLMALDGKTERVI